MTKLNGQKKCFSYVVMLTVSLALTMVCNVKSEGACLQCEELNRKDSGKPCPQDIEECGDCIKGMTQVPWDTSCIPIELKILENPKNATGTIGKPLVLNCKNNHEAECAWVRQGSNIDVQNDKGHYRYLTYTNGVPSKNCDLEIISYRKEDSGWWQCHSSTDYDIARSFKAWIVTSNQVVIMGHPLHAIAQVKKEVFLNCKFNLPVQCEWLHKGKPVRMKKGVYQFVKKEDDNKQREDCSMKISSFKRKDAGEWQCRGAPSGIKNLSSSNKAVLLEGKPQTQKCNKKGDKLILTCYKSQPGECTWQRDKQVVKIASRYKYVAKSESSKQATDCSIIIDKFKDMDAAEWKCGSNSNDESDGKFDSQEKLCLSKGPSLSTKPQKRSKRSLQDGPTIPSINESLPFTLPQVEEGPSSGQYYSGDNLTLQCKFNRAISECFWLRNDHKVDIAHRYQFMDGRTGQNTTDCSIAILKFQEIDLGSWICGSIADDEHNGVLSEASHLNAIDFGSGSYEWEEEVHETDIIFIDDEEADEPQMENAWNQSSISTVFVYVSIAASVETIIIVILLAVILFFCFKKFHHKQEGFTKVNTKYSYMENEINQTCSRAKLIEA